MLKATDVILKYRREVRVNPRKCLLFLSYLVLGTGDRLVPGDGGDLVPHQLGAGGATGQGRGVGARVTGDKNIMSKLQTSFRGL